MRYREEPEQSKAYKQAYLDGIHRVIAQRRAVAKERREAFAENIFLDQEKYRAKLRALLGWPLTEPSPAAPPKITSELLSREDGYAIYRMQLEVLDGLQMTGLFFRWEGEAPRPLVIVQHGGLGSPELISGIHGSTANYNDMLMRVLCRGVHVFAPQLLVWQNETQGKRYGVDYKRTAIDAQLKHVGSSIAALEIYGISRILDYFQAMPDITSFGMVGLSYGGFYTLFCAACDTRIRSSVACAFFNQRDAVSWEDWVWFRSAEMFDDPEVACLVYPRRICLEIADHDPLFDAQKGMESFRRLKALCQSVGTDFADMVLFEGDHEFCKDDAPILRMIEDLRQEG